MINRLWRLIRQQDRIDWLQLRVTTLEYVVGKVNELEDANAELIELLTTDTFKDKVYRLYKNTNYAYSNREAKYVFDLKSFITPNNYVLKKLLGSKRLKGKTEEETIHNCMRWVHKNIRYTDDLRLDGFNEHWKFSEETIDDRYGDCEDHTILLISLLYAAGVPSYKLRGVLGNVRSANNKKLTYHCYPVYLRSDGEWVGLDTTWFPSSKKVADREPIRKDKLYKNPDRSFNHEGVWLQKNFNKVV